MYDEKVPQKVKFSSRMSFVSTAGSGSVIISDRKTGEVPSIDEIHEKEAQAAIQSAYQQGWNECEKQMRSELQELTEKLNTIVSEIPDSLSAYFQELEEQMRKETGDLAFKIAKIILKREIDNEESLKGVISEVLTPLISTNGVKLYLNPSVVELIKSGKGPEVPAEIEVMPNPGLSFGEAVVDSSQGIVDGTLEGRIMTLNEKFNKYLSGNSENV